LRGNGAAHTVVGLRRIIVKVGIPREIKNHEYRVAITPAGVNEFVRHGHEVVVEAGAGQGSSITDDEYRLAGAEILSTADAVWESAEMILKVKEPIAEEYDRMRPGQVLFTYLHLAASKQCTDALLTQKITGIAYETVETADRALPLLAPMSEVAGRLAPQVGAYHHRQRPGLRGHPARSEHQPVAPRRPALRRPGTHRDVQCLRA
jgi:alanine dehydrogenase